jgi:hypothetical protein
MNNSLLPIDVVYTWVDGSDPQWIARNREALVKNGFPEPAKSLRFANHEELRYSMRSIERYMPWVRRIFLVTDHQRPSWLKDGESKVTIVDHSEIFPDRKCLPTFNSTAIEANLHRIPGLGERYVYFNDDMMIGTPFEPEDFFSPDGRPYSFTFDYSNFKKKDKFLRSLPNIYRYFQAMNLKFWIWRNKDRLPPFSVKLRHSRLMIICRLNKVLPFYKTKHTPMVHTLTEARRVEEIFKDDFAICRSHPFRSRNDLFFSELYATVGLLTGLTVDRRFSKKDLFYFHFGRKDNPNLARLRDGAFRFININDGCGDVSREELDKFNATMNELFPQPSSFEK